MGKKCSMKNLSLIHIFTFGYGIHGLCVELPVVDGDIGMDGAGDFDADETAAAAGVCQQVFLVSGCYKGGVALSLIHI